MPAGNEMESTANEKREDTGQARMKPRADWPVAWLEVVKPNYIDPMFMHLGDSHMTPSGAVGTMYTIRGFDDC